jgi:hypothetical protein
MRFARVVLVCATLFVLSVVAQSPNGAINGQVLDPSGGAIADAGIVIVNDVTGLQYTTKTNDEGIYVLANLPPGPYRLQVSKVGFKTLVKPDIILNVQDALAISFTLPIGALAETVTVEGGASLVNTESSAVSTVIDRKFVENIPLNGRSFQDLISMTPGIVTQSPQTTSQATGQNGDFSVNGQRTESNYYTVDGVSANISPGSGIPGPVNGGTLPASTALGTTQSLISVDALQEFRVQSSTYSAEYGRSPGGQFSLVTRSGTNVLHGAVFEYLRNSVFDANNWFNDYFQKPQPALRQNDFGGTVGGPIKLPELYSGKDRTFFFFSYEGLRLTQPQPAAVQYVPDTYLRQQAPAPLQPILNAYPVQNGVDYGTSTSPSLAQLIASYSLPSQIDSISLRLDHTFSPKMALFFRFGNTPSFTSTRLLSALSTQHLDSRTYTLGATSQLTSRMSNEFRWGYADSSSNQQAGLDAFAGARPINLAEAMGATFSPTSFSFFDLNIFGIGDSLLLTQKGRLEAKQWNAIDTFSWVFGRHQLKIGADYRRIISPLTPSSPQVLALNFSAQSVLGNSVDATFLSKSLPATPVFDETAVFVQDEWRIAPRLSLSLGLRWEFDPPPGEAHGNDAFTLFGNVNDPSTLTVAPRGTSLWKPSVYNFAPRLGAAWQPFNRRPGRETVVRAGGGVFLDTDNQVATQGYDGLGFSASHSLFGASLPLPASAFNFAPSTSPPYTGTSLTVFPRHLQLPYTLQWNAALQQSLGKAQAITISYVGAAGRRLVQLQQRDVQSINPSFAGIRFLQSGVSSNYQALQLQLQRTLNHGLQGLASYTWSHCLDFGSSDAALPATRGNCDFDVRHNFQGGLTSSLSSVRGNRVVRAMLDDWGVDGRLSVRSAFPLTLLGNLLTDPLTGNEYYGNLDLVPGQPLYLFGQQYPGGRTVNPAAFSLPGNPNDPGDAPRNFVRGFGAWQINLSLRREFAVREKLRIQFRAEAFNVLNHPNFGYIDPNLTDLLFGQATQTLNQSLGTVAAQYQQGGSRSMQFALKLLY